MRRASQTSAQGGAFQSLVEIITSIPECARSEVFGLSLTAGEHPDVITCHILQAIRKELKVFMSADVDSGQEVSHYSGQNCSGRVVAEWDLGGVSERLTRGLRRALLIRSTGWKDQSIGTGILWRRTAACEWPVTRVSVDRQLDGIRSSTRCLATGRQRSMAEFDSHGSPVLYCCTGHSGRGDCCRGGVSDETPAAPARATAGWRDGLHDSRWRDIRLAGQRSLAHCCPAGLPASCVRLRWSRSFRAFGTGSAV